MAIEKSLKNEINKAFHNMKENELIISEYKMRTLIRNILRAKNTLIVGPSGFGKTTSAICAAKALGRDYVTINLGNTSESYTALIGHLSFKDNETIFHQSDFINAITTENMVVILDEISRAHPDAMNILMTVLDGQRYLRISEKDNQVIKVANGVSFISTANIGAEYTSARVLDRALIDRHTILEVDILNAEQESKLLTMNYPKLHKNYITALSGLASQVRTNLLSADPSVGTFISPRMNLECAGMLYDGFTFEEAFENSILTFFSSEGGSSSERAFVREIAQQFEYLITEVEGGVIEEDILDNINNASKTMFFTEDDIEYFTGKRNLSIDDFDDTTTSTTPTKKNTRKPNKRS